MHNVLTPSLVCRSLLHLVRGILGPRVFETPIEGGAVQSDLMNRHIEFEPGNLALSLDDYTEYYLFPHAHGLVALLKLADVERFAVLPLPPGEVGCRHSFDNISMRLLVVDGKFRVDVLFRPYSAEAKAAKMAAAPLPIYDRIAV